MCLDACVQSSCNIHEQEYVKTWCCYSPLAGQAIAETVDAVTSDGALGQHLGIGLGINSLQRSEGIALHLYTIQLNILIIKIGARQGAAKMLHELEK